MAKCERCYYENMNDEQTQVRCGLCEVNDYLRFRPKENKQQEVKECGNCRFAEVSSGSPEWICGNKKSLYYHTHRAGIWTCNLWGERNRRHPKANNEQSEGLNKIINGLRREAYLHYNNIDYVKLEEKLTTWHRKEALREALECIPEAKIVTLHKDMINTQLGWCDGRNKLREEIKQNLKKLWEE